MSGEQEIHQLEAQHTEVKKAIMTLPIPDRNRVMSKALALNKQINEAKARSREISVEAMTYSDHSKSRYEALAKIQSITAKVIQDAQ